MRLLLALIVFVALGLSGRAHAEDWAAPAEKHVFELEDFEFGTGETLPAIPMEAYP
ncbi:MAG: hypothetical protein WA989_00545 [Henriciella sp.]|uniref:hypothetical protein n=1 Tax=Henriciella sp. TaxID=1968823 RepID=UPI003C70BD5B